MKPDFNTMSRAELLEYLKAHRDDDEAWGKYLDQRNPNTKQYPAPFDEESIKIMEEAIRRKINEQQSSS